MTEQPLTRQQMIEQARKDREEQQRLQDLEAIKRRLRAQYMNAPGATASGFEADWPEIEQQFRVRVALGESVDSIAPLTELEDPDHWNLPA